MRGKRQGFLRNTSESSPNAGKAGGRRQCPGGVNAAFRRVVLPERRAPLRVGDVVEERPDVAAGLATGGFDLDPSAARLAEQLAAETGPFHPRAPGFSGPRAGSAEAR